MPRYRVEQSAAAKPVRILLADVPTAWTTVLEAPDFSISDFGPRFPNERDPLDDTRQIQPGFAQVESALIFHNRSNADCWVELRTLTEGNDLATPAAARTVTQMRVVIPAGDSFSHGAGGQRLLKMNLANAYGDMLQVRAQASGAISLTGAASEGGAEQHTPEQL